METRDGHRAAAPALANLTAAGVTQLGGEAGRKANLQQDHRRHRPDAEDSQGRARGGRSPDVLRPAPAAASLRQTLLLLAPVAQSGDQRAQGQIEGDREPTRPIQAAQQQGAQDPGMDPTGAGEQGQALGGGDQQPVDQQGRQPMLQTLGAKQDLQIEHPWDQPLPPEEHNCWNFCCTALRPLFRCTAYSG